LYSQFRAESTVENSMMSESKWPVFGAFSYGFTDVGQLVQSFLESGLAAVQWGSELLGDALEHPDGIPAVRQQLDDAGITVVGVAGYRNLIAVDEGARERNIDFLQQCLRIAPVLGVPVVATETGTRHAQDWQASPENRSPEALETLYRSLESLLPVAEQSGSILALECYVNNVIATVEDTAQVLERYPTPALQLVLDPFNFISSDLLPEAERFSRELLERFRQHWAIAHLKDVGAGGAEIDTPAFGDGVFPMAHLKAFLRDRRPDLAIVLEHIDFARIPAAIAQFNAIE
jgi:sugar phosphate isomerase/epimerase